MRRFGEGVAIVCLCTLVFVLFGSRADSSQATTAVRASTPVEPHQIRVTPLPTLGDSQLPVTPAPETASLRSTLLGETIRSLQATYSSSEEKTLAIIRAISLSGAPESAFAADGANMIKRLQHRVSVRDWRCYKAACFARLSAESPDLMDAAIASRDSAAPGYIIAITPEPAPDKLVLLLNSKESE